MIGLFHPSYGLKAYKRMAFCYLRNKVLGRPSISSIEFICTLRCNARCGFCSNHKLAPGEQTMTRETGFRVLQETVRNGIPKVIFIGGEGLLDSNIFDYFSFCKENGIIVQYATNGTLLTPATIRKFEDCGVYQVCITFHDGIGELHDKTVGIPGAFDTILRAVDLMKSRGFLVFGKTIYSRESVKNGAFQRVLELCKEKGLAISANPFMPVGRGVDPVNCLGKGELETYYSICRSNRIGDHVYNGWNPGCVAGKTYFGILPGGDILPCYFLPVCVGNIREIGLDEALTFCRTIPLFSRRLMTCPVAGSKELYEQVIRPLYSDASRKLPVDLLKDSEIFERIRKINC